MKMPSTSTIVTLLFLTSVHCKDVSEQREETRLRHKPPVEEAPSRARPQLDTLPFYDDASFTPKWLGNNPSELAAFHTIPAFTLTNQNGEDVTEATFKDKIYVADFFFTTCPGICLTMTQSMSQLQDNFKADDEVLFLSHSVTPTKDTPAVLKSYADAHGAISGKWHMVTGERSTIYGLGRQQYFAEEDLGQEKSEEDFLHTENFLLIDRNRHIRGIYNGLNKTDIRQLTADIKLLKREHT